MARVSFSFLVVSGVRGSMTMTSALNRGRGVKEVIQAGRGN